MNIDQNQKVFSIELQLEIDNLIKDYSKEEKSHIDIFIQKAICKIDSKTPIEKINHLEKLKIKLKKKLELNILPLTILSIIEKKQSSIQAKFSNQWFTWDTENEVKKHAEALGTGLYFYQVTSKEAVIIIFKDKKIKYLLVFGEDSNTLDQVKNRARNFEGRNYFRALLDFRILEVDNIDYFFSNIKGMDLPNLLMFHRDLFLPLFEHYIRQFSQEYIQKKVLTILSKENFYNAKNLEINKFNGFASSGLGRWDFSYYPHFFHIQTLVDAKTIIKYAAASGNIDQIKHCFTFEGFGQTPEAKAAFLQALNNFQFQAASEMIGSGLDVKQEFETHPIEVIMNGLITYISEKKYHKKTGNVDDAFKFLWSLLPESDLLKNLKFKEINKNKKIYTCNKISISELLFYLRPSLGGKNIDPLLLHCLKEGCPLTTSMKAGLQDIFEELPPELQEFILINTRKPISDHEAFLNSPLTPNKLDYIIEEAKKLSSIMENNIMEVKKNPALLDVEALEQFWIIKKAIKGVMALLSDQELLVSDLFSPLLNLYDQLNEIHPVLKFLKQISQEIRLKRKIQEKKKSFQSSNFSPMLTKFFFLWNSESYHMHKPEESDQLIQNLLIDNPREFFTMKLRFLKALKEVYQSPVLSAYGTTYIGHGSGHPTLVSMLTQNQPKLLSLGHLWQVDVPMCGEICGSDYNLNKDFISSVPLEPHFDFKTTRLMDAATYSLVNVLYAEKSFKYREHFTKFDPVETIERVEKFIENPFLIMESLSIIRASILRLRKTQTMPKELLIKLKKTITKLEIQNKNLKDSANGIECIELLKSAIEFKIIPFSAKQLKQIENEFPIVFGSYNQKLRFLPSTRMETRLSSGLNLGKEIKTIFTAPENIERLKDILGDYPGVEVHPFDTIFALEMISMCQGTRTEQANYFAVAHRPVIKPPAHLNPAEQAKYVAKKRRTHSKKVLNHLNKALLEEIFPHYCTKFPEKPSYVVGKNTIFISTPLYTSSRASHKDYVKEVMDGNRPFREIHGTVHATRAMVWSILFHNIMGSKCKADKFLTAMSVGMHDSAREDESKDYWDKESSKNMKNFLRRMGIDKGDSRFLYYSRTISRKDDPAIPREKKTDAGRIVYDADCVEILRCLGGGLSSFRKQNLFISEYLDPKIFDKLLKEINLFILATESLEFKKAFEQETDNPLFHMMLLIRHHRKHFPVLTKFLHKDFLNLPNEIPENIYNAFNKDILPKKSNKKK